MKNFYYSILSIDILHSMLGFPTECIHSNVIRSCTLSFSCWIQGGRHAEGCGNKWLLSCCIPETETDSNSDIIFNGPTLNMMPKVKSQMNPPMFKQNMLRRSGDNGVVRNFLLIIYGNKQITVKCAYHNQVECGVPRTIQNTIQKRIIGGRVAPFAALPWQVHIRIAEYQVKSSFI